VVASSSVEASGSVEVRRNDRVGWLLGLDRQEAVKFSFMLSIPPSGVTVYKARHIDAAQFHLPWAPVLVGLVLTFCSVLCPSGSSRRSRRHRWRIFGIYCVVAGLCRARLVRAPLTAVCDLAERAHIIRPSMNSWASGLRRGSPSSSWLPQNIVPARSLRASLTYALRMIRDERRRRHQYLRIPAGAEKSRWRRREDGEERGSRGS